MREIARFVGVLTGIAAIGWLLFIAFALAWGVADSGGPAWADEYTPLGWLAAGATLVGTIAVARSRWWGALLIFGALVALGVWALMTIPGLTGRDGSGPIALPILIMGVIEAIVAVVLHQTRPARAESAAE